MLPEAVYGIDHLALERFPAHLAVGDDRETGPFLERDRQVDGPVLDALELGGGDPTLREAAPSLEQLRRT
jgi:hypothetical protein